MNKEYTAIVVINGMYYTRNFSTARPFNDVLKWASAMGVSNPRITDITLADYTGSST